MVETLYISGTEFRAAGGKFDARSRYLRNGNTLQSFPIAIGKTLDITAYNFPAYNSYSAAIRYSLAGWVVTTSYTYQPTLDTYIQISGSGYNAPYVMVTT